MNKRLDKRGAAYLLAICWIVYFCSYLGRLNYSSVMSELIGTVLTKSQAGWVNTAFLIAYASGQLINGMLSEKVSPRWLAAAGAVGGGLMNIAFAFARSFPEMVLLRLMTGFFMSMLWPSILCAMVRLMQHDDKVSGTVNIASSMAAGTLVSYAMSAGLIYLFNWEAVFWVPGTLLLLSGILWVVAYPRITRMAVVEVAETGSFGAPKMPGESLPLIRLAFIPVLSVVIVPVILHGVIKDGVSAWVPTYIGEVFGKSTSFSALVSVLLPLFNLTGAYMAQYAYRRLGGNALKGSAVFFGIAALILTLMLSVAKENLALTVLCFALITSSMMAVNVLLINLLPLRFEQYGRSATVSGGLNAIAYGGSALASGMIGVLSSAYGWNATVVSWFILMVVGCALCAVFRGASAEERSHGNGGSVPKELNP